MHSLEKGAESGVVEKEAMKEVDNILDEWFKGGKEDVDDVPDDLPDIVEQPKTTVQKEVKKKKNKSPVIEKNKEEKKVSAKKVEKAIKGMELYIHSLLLKRFIW